MTWHSREPPFSYYLVSYLFFFVLYCIVLLLTVSLSGGIRPDARTRCRIPARLPIGWNLLILHITCKLTTLHVQALLMRVLGLNASHDIQSECHVLII
jgi:hypothetical protein